MSDRLGQSGDSPAVRWALEKGIEAFRRELEDENQHLDDAVRTGILVALDDYRKRTEES